MNILLRRREFMGEPREPLIYECVFGTSSFTQLKQNVLYSYSAMTSGATYLTIDTANGGSSSWGQVCARYNPMKINFSKYKKLIVTYTPTRKETKSIPSGNPYIKFAFGYHTSASPGNSSYPTWVTTSYIDLESSHTLNTTYTKTLTLVSGLADEDRYFYPLLRCYGYRSTVKITSIILTD